MKPPPFNLSMRTAFLIRKHLTGDLTEAESAELEQWIDADLVNKTLFVKTSVQYTADLKKSKPQEPKVALRDLLSTAALVTSSILLIVVIVVQCMNSAPVVKASDKYPEMDFIFRTDKSPGVTITDNRELHCEQASLPSLMEGLKSYYLVPVVFRGKVPPVRYTGTIYHTVSLQTMIDTLQAMGVPVRYTGEELIVGR